MKPRPFGEDAFQCSEIGLGTWQIGSSWGEIDDTTAGKTLEAAVASGVNFFDTADVYGDGLSEKRIARFLKKHGGRVFVATKLGRRGDPGWPANFTAAGIRKHTEDSLRRLEVESLDLTQLHCVPHEELKRGDVFEHLRTLRAEGKIKRFGASVESMDEALTCLKHEGVASLQIIFNLYRQKPIDTLFSEAKKKGVALIIRLPLASGLLSGRFSKATTFGADDHRNFNRDGKSFNVGETFAGLPFEKGVELTEELRALVPEGMPLARFSLRWILDFDAVSVIIPGATRPEQARENTTASDLPPLSKELHAKLRAFYHDRVHPHIRGPY